MFYRPVETKNTKTLTWGSTSGLSRSHFEDPDASEALSGEHCSDVDEKEAEQRRRDQETEEKRKILAKNESRVLNGLRVAVILVLLITTAVVSVGVYQYTSKDQKEDFKSEFLGFADRIMDSFHTTVEHKLGAIDSFSVSITSFALHSGSNFPNVTIPDFEIRGASARVVADSTFIRWMPLVTREQRPGWEAYASQNHMWLEKAYISEKQQTLRQDIYFNASKSLVQSDGMRRDLALTDHIEHSFLDEEDPKKHKIPRNTQEVQQYVPYIYRLPQGPKVPVPEDEPGPFLIYW